MTVAPASAICAPLPLMRGCTLSSPGASTPDGIDTDGLLTPLSQVTAGRFGSSTGTVSPDGAVSVVETMSTTKKSESPTSMPALDAPPEES